MKPDSPVFRRLHLLQDVGPLDQEILQEQATSLGRMGRALERALTELRAFDADHGIAEQPFGATLPPDLPAKLSPEKRTERATLRDRAGHALWQFVIQREACGMRDVRQMMRDYRVPPDVQLRMGAMTGAKIAKPPAGR